MVHAEHHVEVQTQPLGVASAKNEVEDTDAARQQVRGVGRTFQRAGEPSRFRVLVPLPRWPWQWAHGLEAIHIALRNLPYDVVLI